LLIADCRLPIEKLDSPNGVRTDGQCPEEILTNPFSRRLLKRAQMQGGKHKAE